VRESDPQPIWAAVLAARPEAFVFLGDNIYGDSDDVAVLRAKYARLAAAPGFAALRDACRVLATWDDHDYGQNDAGAEYPTKRESQAAFLDFWRDPPDSPRRAREGVYDALTVGPPGRRVQFILLDTRYFRTALKKKLKREPGTGPYQPDEGPGAAMLGEAQWAWLEARLREPAEVRLLCSSVQVIADEQTWEKWGNFPRERDRLFKLVRDTKAGGVIVVSGDRHFSELSRLDDAVGYPLYDLTSSSLNRPMGPKSVIEPNGHRVSTPFRGENFGLITVDWDAPDPTIELQTIDVHGKPAFRQPLKLSQLRAR
jgi:alkaline phosphatase D